MQLELKVDYPTGADTLLARGQKWRMDSCCCGSVKKAHTDSGIFVSGRLL